jgi:hypothetical protein
VNRSLWIRAGAVVAAIALVVAFGATFASVFGGSGTASPDTTVPSLELEPTTTTTLTAAQQALAALLPDGPLDGMTRSDVDLGPLTVTSAASEYPFGDPDGARLKAAGFVQGFSRAWEGADGRSAHVLVYEMKDPNGFMAAWKEAVKGVATGTFDTPVGEGLSDVETDDEGENPSEASIVAWVDGTYWYYVVHFGPADGTGADNVRAIVAAVQQP